MADISTPLLPKMLEKNRCFHCKKYLSYGPVKIYPSGNISCGRCSPTEGSPGTVSLYEKVAPYLVFPCIYQPQGCSVQLHYDEVKDHEKICPQKEFRCPSCPVMLGHNDTFLRKFSNHFENIHSDDFLKIPEFFLNVNNFDTTERNLFFSKRELMLFMLLFVKFDGQWLHINVSVPHGYGVNNFNQVVTNLGIPKYCSSLGDNSDCFKFFLPRMLDCIAKIGLNVVEDTIEISISFLPNELSTVNVLGRIKSELDPPYIPEFYWYNDFKKLHAEIDFDAYSIDGNNKSISIKNDKILFGKCNFCKVFIWESFLGNPIYYMCAHYDICLGCYNDGYKKCKFDNALFKAVYATQIPFQVSCRYGCGSYINYLRYKDHEKMCKFNILKFHSDSEMANLCFGIFQDNQLFVHNSIIKFYLKPGENKSCYIVTNGNQKCIFYYKCINENDFFEVEHEYDKTKFTSIIEIKCTDNTVREEQDFFHRNDNNKNYFHHNEESEYLLFSIKIVDRNEIFIKLKGKKKLFGPKRTVELLKNKVYYRIQTFYFSVFPLSNLPNFLGGHETKSLFRILRQNLVLGLHIYCHCGNTIRMVLYA